MTGDMILTSVPVENLEARLYEIVEKALQRHFSQLTLPKQGEELLTRKEAAKMLGISLQTLNEWTKEGRISGYRISSRVRYKRTELVDALTKIKAINSIHQKP